MILDALDYDNFSSTKFLRLVRSEPLDDPLVTLEGYRNLHGYLVPHRVTLSLVDGLLLIQKTKIAMTMIRAGFSMHLTE